MKIVGIIAGILLTLSGGYCLMYPGLTFISLGWLIGASILIYGIGAGCAWFRSRGQKTAGAWELVSAILAVAFGILILVNIKTRLVTDMVLITLAGVWLGASGIIRIIGSIKLKPSWWGLGVVWGFFLILAAAASLLHPMIAVLSMGYCIAFGMITQGINLLLFTCLTAKRVEAE